MSYSFFDPSQIIPGFNMLGHHFSVPDAEGLVYCCRLVANSRPNVTAVEVGSYVGSTALLMLHEGHLDRVWCVDTWKGSDTDKELYEWIKSDDDICLMFYLNMRDYIQLGECIPLRVPSLQAARIFDEGSLDLVFLDGDHSYQAVRDDIEAWAPKVRKGGILCGHDFLTFEGVMQAVLEYGHSGRYENVWWRLME